MRVLFSDGDLLDAVLALRLRGDENKTTVKNRLKRAAKDLGVGLRFQRSGSDVVIFQVTSRE